MYDPYEQDEWYEDEDDYEDWDYWDDDPDYGDIEDDQQGFMDDGEYVRYDELYGDDAPPSPIEEQDHDNG